MLYSRHSADLDTMSCANDVVPPQIEFTKAVDKAIDLSPDTDGTAVRFSVLIKVIVEAIFFAQPTPREHF